MSVLAENVRWCPLCDRDRDLGWIRQEPATSAPELWPRFADMTVEVVRCLACRFVFVQRSFAPNLVEAFYEDETGGSIPVTSENLGWWLQNTEMALSRILDRLDPEPRGSLLDVGCGRGAFLVLAQRRGWEVSGAELNPEYAKFISDELDIPVHLGALADVQLPKDHFGVITLLDVIEHLYDPVTELRRCVELLRPGGLLVVKTPNWRGQLAKEQIKRLLRRGPGNIAYLGHINQFDGQSLRCAFSRAGLVTIAMEPALTFLPAVRGAEFNARRTAEYATKRVYNSAISGAFRLTRRNMAFNVLGIARRRES